MERDVRESARLVAELTVQRRTAVQNAVAALNRAADVMVSNSRESAEEIEEIVLNRAVELAEALLQRELSLSDTVAQDALARALRYVPHEIPVTVRLAPADHATLVEDPSVLGADAQRLTLVADPSLSPGDCIAVCGVTRVDARLGEGLARVKAILSQ
jgi:flagellar assembly protein FliH